LRALTLIALLFAAPALAADMNWEPAPRADDFVDSMGVCTHWGYGDTPYGKSYDLIKQRLAESGIRHLRDGLHPRETELFRDLGIRVTAISEPQMKPLPQQVASWISQAAMFDTIEGPNEPNNFWPQFGTQYRGQGWPQGLRLYQDDLYAAIRAQPALRDISVASPTPIFDGPYAAAPLNSFDLLALHPYAGGDIPSSSIAFHDPAVRITMAIIGANHDLKPFIATESGYHNCVADRKTLGGNQAGISETAGGRYLPRHFAEYWNAGVVRTFVYELADEAANPREPEANFGLLRNDASPKPAFTALANMNAILSEGHWDADQQRWEKPDAPARAVQLQIDAAPKVHHLALSRADGQVDLLLWDEVRSFDLSARKDLNPAPAPAMVRLAAATAAELYRPLLGREVQKKFDAATSFALEVPDEVIIIRFKTALPTGEAPEPPHDLSAVCTATSARLTWRSAGAGAFVIHRLGRYVGTATPAADGSATFTDASLIPGVGFAYTVRAVGAGGLLSAPATVVAHTPNERPDLIVESIAFEPPQPKPGDEVRFVATIANIGNAPTPAVTHGVAFSVDGKTACWSDTYHQPLAPNERVTVKTNNGPLGKGTWTCEAGMSYVLAFVDDQHRIEESNRDNNSRQVVLSTGTGPDLIVTNVHADGDVRAGKSVGLFGTVRNIGTAASPADVIISCTFLRQDPGAKEQTLGYGSVKGPLAPGDQVEIKMEKPWLVPKSDSVKIVGIVDDINRIAELDKANNRSKPITIEIK
jgi:hypothetical protein